MPNTPFSKRQGYRPDPEIRFVRELPERLRQPLMKIAIRHLGSEQLLAVAQRALDPYGIDPKISKSAILSSSALRAVDSSLSAVHRLVQTIPWFRVYDIAEAVYRFLVRQDRQPGVPVEGSPRAPAFELEMNDYFTHAGIGWQLVNGEIIRRGAEAFEAALKTAQAELHDGGRPTAARRIHDALRAVSRQPEPDTEGAISHAIAALECVAGDITGNTKGTLGDILKDHSALFPGALKKGLEGVWGYSCNEGARHGKEGKEPEREEAELIVGLAAVVATYLSRKARMNA